MSPTPFIFAVQNINYPTIEDHVIYSTINVQVFALFNIHRKTGEMKLHIHTFSCDKMKTKLAVT